MRTLPCGSVCVEVLMHLVMPKLPVSASSHPDQKQTAILRQPRFLAHLLLSILTFTSLFTAYTYLADILERLGGIPAGQVGWWLMGFGAVGMIGNCRSYRDLKMFVFSRPYRPAAVTGLFCVGQCRQWGES